MSSSSRRRQRKDWERYRESAYHWWRMMTSIAERWSTFIHCNLITTIYNYIYIYIYIMKFVIQSCLLLRCTKNFNHESTHTRVMWDEKFVSDQERSDVICDIYSRFWSRRQEIDSTIETKDYLLSNQKWHIRFTNIDHSLWSLEKNVIDHIRRHDSTARIKDHDFSIVFSVVMWKWFPILHTDLQS